MIPGSRRVGAPAPLRPRTVVRMARIGGRNSAFAWIVGVASAVIVGTLLVLALPLLPASVSWVGDTMGTAQPSPEETVDAGDGTPSECAEIYGASAWASLRTTPGSFMTPSQEAPVTTAAELVAALQPQVVFTCTWVSDEGTVSTTLATVPPDAGAIAAASLPAAGFACGEVADRIRCTRLDETVTESIELGGGYWLSSSEAGWHPGNLTESTAQRLWR